MPNSTSGTPPDEQAAINTATTALLTAILMEMSRGPDGMAPVLRVLVDAHHQVKELAHNRAAEVALSNRHLEGIFNTIKHELVVAALTTNDRDNTPA